MISSCAIKNAPAEIKTVPTENIENTIVFVVFKIKKGTPKSSIELVSTMINEGKFKKQSEDILDSNKLLSIEISDGHNISQTFKINHPLYKHVEYVDETGKLEKKEVEVTEETFFIRFQTKNKTNAIKIKEKITDSSEIEIANFKV